MRWRFKRKATFIVSVATLAGLLLIFAAAASRTIRDQRAERRCQEGELAACTNQCSRGNRSACGRLEQRCSAGETAACEARRQAPQRRRGR